MLQAASLTGTMWGMRKFVPAILLCLILSVANAARHGGTQKTDKWNQVELWRHKLKTNMTDRDVFEILGQPKDTELIRRIMTWYFQEPVERIDAKVTYRPECGIVKFTSKRLRGSRQPVFLVSDWKEPDWEQLKKIADAKAAEKAAAEAQVAHLKAEQDRKAAELKQAELAKQQARQQQLKQERTQARQKEAEVAKSSIVDQIIMKIKKPDKDTFVYGGVGLGILVVVGFILVKRPW
jgi:hypothetical protein